MTTLTTAQKKSVGNAVDFLQSVIDCYKKLDKKHQTVPAKQLKEIERMTKAIKKLNKDGKIDFQTRKFTILASADRKGIHLNDKWGNNYKNDYDIPDDYNLDDCKKGKFHDLWRLLEILIHENYHVENHSGIGGSLKKVGIAVAQAVGSALVEGIGNLFRKKPYLRTKYKSHEHQTYSYTHHLLFQISMMLSILLREQSATDPCIPCPLEHIKRVDAARERQNPYEWVR
ncbi:MAG: hypothetical protein O2854_07395 [Chloroflexi bacterium]|nr:hypothetical protein [Chloroflexota bacterium]